MPSDSNWWELYDQVFAHSNNTDYKDYDKTLNEWVPGGYSEEGGHCLCGKEIIYCHTIKHVSGIALESIGSKCIKKFPDRFSDAAMAVEKTVRTSKNARAKAIAAAQWAVAIAAQAKASAVERAEERAERERMWQADVEARRVRRVALDAESLKGRGALPVPDNFRSHQGKTLAQVWEHHRAYCEWMLRVGHVKDPVVRGWMRNQADQ